MLRKPSKELARVKHNKGELYLGKDDSPVSARSQVTEACALGAIGMAQTNNGRLATNYGDLDAEFVMELFEVLITTDVTSADAYDLAGDDYDVDSDGPVYTTIIWEYNDSPIITKQNVIDLLRTVEKRLA